MCKRILSATFSVKEKTATMTFSPGINILSGEDAEDILVSLAGIFGGEPTKSFKAVLLWKEGVMLSLTGLAREEEEHGHVFLKTIKTEENNAGRVILAFHKERFMNFYSKPHLFDGRQLPAGSSGASDLLLEKLRDTLAIENNRPLFICNFLERLDEAVDLQPIFEALNATGRQVFIADPLDILRCKNR